MKARIAKLSRQLHQWLVYLSLFALFAFVVSAFTHPLMAWTGPQSSTFMPPTMLLNGSDISAIPTVLRKLDIAHALVSKVVPSEDGNLLQITIDDDVPRRYFSLQTGKELLDHDQQQAIWLARYYTNDSSPIKSVEFITEFTPGYPWVNRLIPVYRVTFDNDDNLSAYVYTETNALAALNNDWKRNLQRIFHTFHSYTWLDNRPLLRMVVISLLLLSLLTMLFTGLNMLLLFKRKRYRSRAQCWHRRLAWIIFLPLLGFTVSGVYHLFHYEYADNVRGMRLGSPVSLQHLTDLDLSHLSTLSTKKLNSFSIIEYNQQRFFRASIAGEEAAPENQAQTLHSHHQRNRRFDGIAKEHSAKYIPLLKKTNSTVDDRALAIQLALNYLSLPVQSVTSIERITRFGADYDFRNKRLPVWKVSTDTTNGDSVFVDPSTGILVDHVNDRQRYESYSFSVLHKWNFLLTVMQRMTRDYIIVLMLLLIAVMSILGIRMRFSHQ